jgi:hypothetical protein
VLTRRLDGSAKSDAGMTCTNGLTELTPHEIRFPILWLDTLKHLADRSTLIIEHALYVEHTRSVISCWGPRSCLNDKTRLTTGRRSGVVRTQSWSDGRQSQTVTMVTMTAEMRETHIRQLNDANADSGQRGLPSSKDLARRYLWWCYLVSTVEHPSVAPQVHTLTWHSAEKDHSPPTELRDLGYRRIPLLSSGYKVPIANILVIGVSVRFFFYSLDQLT